MNLLPDGIIPSCIAMSNPLALCLYDLLQDVIIHLFSHVQTTPLTGSHSIMYRLYPPPPFR
jgi:hypothetical protein